MSRYVLDSFALLAMKHHEAGELRVRQLLRNAGNRFWMSIVNMGEVYYRVLQEEDEGSGAQVLRWMDTLPISFVDINRQMTLEAARIKAGYAISYADSFAAALAIRVNAKVVTGDREFLPLEQRGIIELVWLPSRR